MDLPLQKNILRSGERMVEVHPEGKASQTKFKLLENYPAGCWLEAKPKTGRTHQIRVHVTHLGHPILGDLKYGHPPASTLKHEVGTRLYLHARGIQFTLNETPYAFQADLDAQFDKTMQFFRSIKGTN